MPSPDLERADQRTLALARPDISAEELDRYLRYQRALLIALEGGAALVEGHLTALEQSGLDAGEQARLAAVTREFAGKQATVSRVKQRLQEAEARGDWPRAAALRPEYERLIREEAWLARFGHSTLRLLREREDALAELHRALQTLELRPAPGPG
jgi:hypothetical protein